ncbi:MAG: hypothetical protein ACFFER_20240, partial [Candidatus Thorarchaeota archaeon]
MSKDHRLSADGDESSASITSFSETTSDDMLLFPDSDSDRVLTSSITVVEKDGSGTTQEYGTDSNTHTNTTTEYDPDASGGIQPEDSFTMYWDYDFLGPGLMSTFNFTLPMIGTGLEAHFIYQARGGTSSPAGGASNGTTGASEIYLYDHDSSTWDLISNEAAAEPVVWTWSTTSSEYWNNDDRTVMFKINASISTYTHLWFHYLKIRPTTTTTVYAESFADVSDCIYPNLEAGDSFTSDGDIGVLECAYGGTAEYDGFGANGISGYYDYFELRYKVNTTSGYVINFATYSSDNWVTNNLWLTLPRTEALSWYTYKYPYFRSGESWRFTLYLTSSVSVKVQIDYIRFSPADEMGWQHDGSTTEGVENQGTADVSYSKSTDGDILTLNATYSGAGSVSTWHLMRFDTTATKSDIERDYYPFGQVRYRVTGVSGVSPYIRFYSEGTYTQVAADTDGGWHAAEMNILASTGASSYTVGFMFYYYGMDTGDTIELEMDYSQVYSIANWTITQGAGQTANDVL